MSIFYGTEIEIVAGFGPVGNTEKKNWANYEQLLRSFFFMFLGVKTKFEISFKYCSVCTKNLHKMKLKKCSSRDTLPCDLYIMTLEHSSTVHEDIKPNMCSKCNESFTINVKLTKNTSLVQKLSLHKTHHLTQK